MYDVRGTSILRTGPWLQFLLDNKSLTTILSGLLLPRCAWLTPHTRKFGQLKGSYRKKETLTFIKWNFYFYWLHFITFYFNFHRKISITRVNIAETLSMPLNEISEELNTDEFRIWALSLTLHLLCELSTLYQHLSSFREIFEPILQCLESERLPLHRYPHSIQVSSFKKNVL